MPSIVYTQDGRIGRLTTTLGKDKLLLLRMTAIERLSESFTVIVDAVSEKPVALHTLLGTNATVEFASDDRADVNRTFNGEVWEYSELEMDEEGYHCRLTLRPQAEFMTLNRRNRVFQKKSVKEIVTSVLGDHNVLNSFKTSAAYGPVEYCVQYQESDFDFASRLLEYEGIYYFYTHGATTHELVMIDDRNAHVDMAPALLEVEPRADRDHSYIWSVIERRGVGPTKVSVDDYDFTTPQQKLIKARQAPEAAGLPAERHGGAKGAGAHVTTAEIYDFPAKYASTELSTGERYSEVWLDAHRRQMARSFAEGDVFAAAVGRRVKMHFKDHSLTETATVEYLIVGTTHRYAGPSYQSGDEAGEDLVVELELMPATDQYRPAQRTPRPRIYGPQTAVVVGQAGEEISTDEYGRIYVQFHWDREGKSNETSSCLVRVAQSAAGKAWGSFSLPRMGQEVVVEFLDGDPDRPLVTGALYNADNVTPAALPANKTQFGLRTRSTKGGGGFNHLWFEDKKGEEVVWFRAERDYKMHIVNADEERQYDKGNRKVTFQAGNDELIISKGTRTETIEGHDTKTIKTGNRVVAIDTGNLDTTVKTGDETRAVKTGKRTTTIQQDETLDVKMGNRKTTLSMGNDSLKLSLGNVDIKLDLGAHKTDAMQAIELKCGMSTIKMTPASIEIKSLMVTVEATTVLQTKGLLIQQEASALQIVKGGLVMIN